MITSARFDKMSVTDIDDHTPFRTITTQIYQLLLFTTAFDCKGKAEGETHVIHA